MINTTDSLLVQPKESGLIKSKQEIKGFTTMGSLYVPTEAKRNLNKKTKKLRQRLKKQKRNKVKSRRKLDKK